MKKPELFKDHMGDVHAGAHNGMDYTLCGLALEGEDGDEAMKLVSRGRVSCADCAQIILYCKSIPLRSVRQSVASGATGGGE